jgi:hypothetical protein
MVPFSNKAPVWLFLHRMGYIWEEFDISNNENTGIFGRFLPGGQF